MEIEPYTLTAPQIWSSFCVFSSPHSGRDYPQDFVDQSRLSMENLRSSEDAFVDELVASAPEHGAPLLAARFPRAFVDVNRAREELDSALIEGVKSRDINPRVVSGLGVVPRVVARGQQIRTGKISLAAAEARLKRAYDPYHGALGDILGQTRRQFGQVLLLDFHSMPNDALTNVTNRGGVTPEIILGDRFGAASKGQFLDQVQEAFEAEGFAVSRNIPFAGAYITRRYGRPSEGVSVIQVEIDRALYLQERLVEKSALFAKTQRRMAAVVKRLTRIGMRDGKIAAE